MSINYAQEQPRDKNGTALQNVPPAYLGNQRFTSENAAVSSVVTLSDDTTEIEVAALGTSAVVRWVASTDTQASVISAAGATANYDVIIPVNTIRKLVVPQERQGTSSIVGAGVQAGTYRRVAWKSVGVGSIMSVEF